MQLFLYEWLSAGGAGGNASSSLRREGWAMLVALARDFQRVPGVCVTTLLHESCPQNLGHVCQRIGFGEERNAFARISAASDAVLVIAPESGGILAERSLLVLDAGKILLGSTPAAIELTADKLALADHFAARGVPTPPTVPANQAGKPDLRFPLVCKPRHGAGSQATILVRDRDELAAALSLARDEEPDDDLILQSHVPGDPASVAFLIGPQQRLALSPATQRLSEDGRFRYLGGSVPLRPPLAERAVALGMQALQGIEGLRGFVGVDLILGLAGDHVIEVNPRPTTSYIGLRQLALDNLAEVWLRVLRGEEVSPLRWRREDISWSTSS